MNPLLLMLSHADFHECTELVSQLARSPCCALHAAVARSADPAGETVDLVTSDPAPDGIESVCWNSSAHGWLINDKLRKFITRSAQLARRIVKGIGTFAAADKIELAEAVAAHSAPSVHKSLLQSAGLQKVYSRSS